MATRIITYAEHPELLDAREWGQVWPEYNGHGDFMSLYWSDRYEVFPEFQYFLYDDDLQIALAKGHSAPCTWDGTIKGLPQGIDEVIAEAFALKESGRPANTLTALAIEIPLEHQGKGLSTVMVHAHGRACGPARVSRLIAPVRPNWKERYPLTPIERYAAWTRADGLPLIRWLRVHHRAGERCSNRRRSRCASPGRSPEWEQWTSMAFPETGSYVFPHGLAPVDINRDQDLGRYWEPNVWVRHRVESHS